VTSHPLLDCPLLLDEHVPGLSSFLIKAEKSLESLTAHRVSIPLTDFSFEGTPDSQEPSAKRLSLTSRHKFCEVWLVSGTLAWVVDEHPDSRTRAIDWINPLQASLDLQLYFFSYTSRVSALPLFHLFRVVPIASLLFYSTSHSFTVVFNFAFLCSIYWELALIYIKPGRADHQKSLFLYFA
jgi:hypothetical protein